MGDDMNIEEPDPYLGYMPRTLNTYEQQILKSWSNPADVIGIVDRWVRKAAIGTDLRTREVDDIIEDLTAHVSQRRKDMLASLPIVNEIRTHLIDVYRLDPDL